MDELARKRNQMALERYYKLKNGGSSGDNYNGITTSQTSSQAATNETEKEEKKNKGGILGGIGYLGYELGLGIVRSLEGIVDYTVGGVADLFGADDIADNMLKTDWLNYNAADEWYNPGAGWEFAGDVASGVGGMLPAVAVTWATGGTAGAVLGSAIFGVGSAGQATSEQTKKNGSAGGREWLYGTASGALEAGIEAISGGIGGTSAGKVLGKTFAKSTGGKIATSFIGEGLEEVASDILNPVLQRATGVDKNAQVDWGNLPRTFLVGGTTGAVMGGGQRALSAAQVGGFNNLNAIETAQEINERMSDNNVRQALGKKEIYTQKDIAEARDRLSANLQRMDEKTCAAFLKQNARIAPMFNADGTVKQSVWENAQPVQTGARYSIKNVGGKNTVVVDTDQDIFEGKNTIEERREVARQYILDKFRNQDFSTSDQKTVNITRKGAKKMTNTRQDEKIRVSTELNNLIATGDYSHSATNEKNVNPEYDSFEYYNVDFILNGKTFSGLLNIGVTKDGKGVFYDMTNVKEKGVSVNSFGENSSTASSYTPFLEGQPSTNSISEKTENVNSFSQKNGKTDKKEIATPTSQARNDTSGNSQSIGNLADVSYSSSLKGRESTLKYQPVADVAQVNADIKKALRNIELLTGGRVDIVITAEEMLTADGQRANGEYADGVIYVSANADSYTRVMFVISHEMIHTLEGTEQYGRLGAFIREQINGNSDFAERYDLEKYRSAYANAQAGEFSEETLDYQAETEMYADFVAREILGKEDTVRRLAAKERNIAARFLEWARSALRRLGGGRADSAEYKALKQAEKLLSAAIENAKGGVTLEDVEKDVQRMKALRDRAEVKEEVKSSENETTSRYVLDKKRKKSYYEQWKSDAFAWANRKNTKIGDMSSGSDSQYVYFYKAIDAENEGKATDYKVISKIPFTDEEIINEWYEEVKENNERNHTSLYDSIDEYERIGAKYQSNNAIAVGKQDGNGRVGGSYQEKSESNGKRNSSKGGRNQQSVRHSLDVNIEEKVKKHYGSTYRWSEAGYIMRDGTRLDLSGRNEGARGGYRTVDHRDIFDVDESGDTYGADAMIEFIGKGNIRVMPENPGINLQVEPNEEQYRLIQDFVERVGWKEEYFSVDIDNAYGDTIETLTYEGKVSGRKVVADIKYYFKEGKVPYKSQLSAFRYSIDIDNYSEKQYNDYGWARVNDVLTYRENADFRAKYGEIKSGKQKEIHRTADGEIVVAVNDQKQDRFGVNNVLVLAKGTYENYKITKVIRINLNDETSIEIVRGFIYESKGIVDESYFDGILEIYNAEDFQYGTQRVGSRESGDVDGLMSNERGTSSKIGRYSIDIEESAKAKRDSGYVSALRNYVHRLNLTEEMKSDIIEKYGEKQAERIFSVWENTTNRADGVDIATAHDGLWREGFRTYSTYEEDFLMDMDTTLRGKLTTEEQAVVDELLDGLYEAISYKNNKTKGAGMR